MGSVKDGKNNAMGGFSSFKRTVVGRFGRTQSHHSNENSNTPMAPPNVRDSGQTPFIESNTITRTLRSASGAAQVREDSRYDDADQVPTSPLQISVVEPTSTAVQTILESEAGQIPDTARVDAPNEQEQAAGLWDIAYTSLREEFTDLFDIYEATIMKLLARKKEALDLEMEDFSEFDVLMRRDCMTEALEVWLTGTGEVEGDADPETAIPKAHSLRDTMRLLVRRQPHISLGWLATCLAIDVCRYIHGIILLLHLTCVASLTQPLLHRPFSVMNYRPLYLIPSSSLLFRKWNGTSV